MEWELSQHNVQDLSVHELNSCSMHREKQDGFIQCRGRDTAIHFELLIM